MVKDKVFCVFGEEGGLRKIFTSKRKAENYQKKFYEILKIEEWKVG